MICAINDSPRANCVSPFQRAVNLLYILRCISAIQACAILNDGLCLMNFLFAPLGRNQVTKTTDLWQSNKVLLTYQHIRDLFSHIYDSTRVVIQNARIPKKWNDPCYQICRRCSLQHHSLEEVDLVMVRPRRHCSWYTVHIQREPSSSVQQSSVLENNGRFRSLRFCRMFVLELMCQAEILLVSCAVDIRNVLITIATLSNIDVFMERSELVRGYPAIILPSQM